MATAATALVTFAEFEKLPDPLGSRLELHNGEVVDVPPAKHGHRVIQLNIETALRQAAGPQMLVNIEVGFKIRDLDYRTADVAVVPLAQWNCIPRDGYLESSPEVVIEVLSPSNTPTRMRATEQLCLENGCREFWIVDPKKQTVRISTPTGHFTIYKSGELIPLLYGGALAVNSLFV